jgi:hypothetical protein
MLQQGQYPTYEMQRTHGEAIDVFLQAMQPHRQIHTVLLASSISQYNR